MQKGTSKEGQTSLNREKFSGLVAPYLDYLYKIFLDSFFERHDFKVPSEFWIGLTFTIYSWILYVTGVNVWWPISFTLFTLVVFTFYNSSTVRRKVFPKDDEMIDSFLNNLQTKSQCEILDFLTEYKLDTKHLIQILNQLPDKYDVYLFIYRYQSIQSELVAYLVDHKAYSVTGDELFAEIILYSKNKIGRKRFKQLKEQKIGTKTNKTLNLCYPFYLKEHRIFKFFADFYHRVRYALNYGPTVGNIIGITLLMSFMIVGTFVFLYQERFNGEEIVPTLFTLGIALFFGLLLISSILVRSFIKIYRRILYRFTPDV